MKKNMPVSLGMPSSVLMGFVLPGVYMTIDEWKMKNDYIKRYAHFDRRVKLTDVWDEVNSPAFVKTHGFFPFIHYTKKNKKFNKKRRN